MKIKPLTVIAVIVATVLFMAIRGCQKSRSELNATMAVLDMTEQKFKDFKTKSDLNAARSMQAIFNLESLLAARKAEIARLAKELGIKPKSIKEIVHVEVEGKDSVVLVRLDTVYYPYPSSPELPPAPVPYVYEDKWNHFEAFVDGDQVGLLYTVTDSITIVSTQEKGGTVISALSSNPAIRITGMSSVTVKDKKIGRFGIGPQITVGYTDKPVFVPGIGVHWSLIRF